MSVIQIIVQLMIWISITDFLLKSKKGRRAERALPIISNVNTTIFAVMLKVVSWPNLFSIITIINHTWDIKMVLFWNNGVFMSLWVDRSVSLSLLFPAAVLCPCHALSVSLSCLILCVNHAVAFILSFPVML